MAKTLHVAVCNTNFADRKQLERLLNKVADTIKTQCLLYTETFGSASALLFTKRVYDAYFIEVHEENYNSYSLVCELQKRDIESPMIFILSETKEKENIPQKDSYYFMCQPVHQEDLAEVLLQISSLKEKRHIPKVEFRNNKETFYLEPKHILYIDHHGLTMFIHMDDGSEKIARGEIQNAFASFSPYPSFFMPSKNTIINAQFIKKVSNFKVTLKDETSIAIPLFVANKIQLLLKHLQ